jgi:polar amino acid transport system substrate-binding protein
MRKMVGMLALALAIGIAVGQEARAQQSRDPRVADLVQAGKIRVGVGVVAPHWAIKAPATGELRGLAIDLARALASRLGVDLVTIEYPSSPRVLDGLKDGAWNIGFLAIDPSRAALVDFTAPYLQIDATYLVPAGSPIHETVDVDQSGSHIAVTRNSVEQFVLAPTLKRAELVPVDTITAGFEALSSGKVEAFAAPRPALLQLTARLPGSHVLEGRFHAALGAIAIPKGQAGRLAYLNEFVEQAKSLGLVQEAIERANLRGVQVAPPGKPSGQ